MNLKLQLIPALELRDRRTTRSSQQHLLEKVSLDMDYLFQDAAQDEFAGNYGGATLA